MKETEACLRGQRARDAANGALINRCVITGASSGIGRALALLLASKHKARMVINARNEALLDDTAKLVQEAGGQAVCIPGDVSEASVPAQLVEACVTNFGGIDLLVNNAGLAKPGPIGSLTVADWRYVFEVNFFSALAATYAALPHFQKSGSGKVINIASLAGKVSFPGSVCYAASKFAMVGMSEGMAAELEQQGIDVITVCPGWVRTEFFKNVNMPDARNPTAIAGKKDLKGWLMRNVLSISSDEAADTILRACEKKGSREILLTWPAAVVERLQGLCPQLVAQLSKSYKSNR